MFSYTDLQNGECEEMHRGSFGFSEYPLGKQKNIQKEEQERAVKELISCLNSTVRDICTFAVLCWLTRLICRFTRVYEGHFMLCFKEEFKVE